MPEREGVLEVVREWVAKAEGDLKNAAHTLRLGRDCPTDTACFHAQQCVEKYLKALLILNGVDFPKTHNIRAIVSLLPPGRRPQLTLEEQRRMTDYATGARYPGWPDIPLSEAREAVAIARRVRREIRRVLPREILRRRTS